MSNQITAAISKAASFLNMQQSLPSTTANPTVQPEDSIEQRKVIQGKQADMDREQARISQEIGQCQSSLQKINDALDAMLTERENIKDKVEALYMKLYSFIHGKIDDNEDAVSQEEYQGSNEVYEQLCHQKSTLESRLVEMDVEIERLDIEMSEISEREGILLDEQLALDLRKEESLDDEQEIICCAGDA